MKVRNTFHIMSASLPNSQAARSLCHEAAQALHLQAQDPVFLALHMGGLAKASMRGIIALNVTDLG